MFQIHFNAETFTDEEAVDRGFSSKTDMMHYLVSICDPNDEQKLRTQTWLDHNGSKSELIAIYPTLATLDNNDKDNMLTDMGEEFITETKQKIINNLSWDILRDITQDIHFAILMNIMVKKGIVKQNDDLSLEQVKATWLKGFDLLLSDAISNNLDCLAANCEELSQSNCFDEIKEEILKQAKLHIERTFQKCSITMKAIQEKIGD